MKIENNNYQNMTTNQTSQKKTMNFSDIFNATAKSQQSAASDSVDISAEAKAMNNAQSTDDVLANVKDVTNEERNALNKKYGITGRQPDEYGWYSYESDHNGLFAKLRDMNLISEEDYQMAVNRSSWVKIDPEFMAGKGRLIKVSDEVRDHPEEVDNLMVAYRDLAFISLRVSMNESQWDEGRDSDYYKREAEAYNRIADVLDQMYGKKTSKKEVLEIIG